MAVATGQLVRPAVTRSGDRLTGFDRAAQIVAYVVLGLTALLMFVPFLFALATSFKTNAEANQLALDTLFWPQSPTLSAYRGVLEGGIGRAFFNSIFIAAIWVIGHAVFDTMAGYAFARMNFPGKNIVFFLILSTLMIPGMVILIPQFILLQRLGFLNSYAGLTIPFLSGAFGIFLTKQFFESIPRELEEAARIDGASRFRMFVQIILPNAMPALTALAIFSFQGSWNSFLQPLLFNNRADLMTLPVRLAYFRQENVANWPTTMAISILTTIPMAIVFVIFQRYFVESNASAGIKG